MSYPEAVFHLNSIPLLWKSREVVYLAADYPENRVRTLKRQSDDVDDPDNNQLFNDGIIEYYQNRPSNEHFEKMPFIIFAAWYTKTSNAKKSCKDENNLNCNFTNEIKLQNGKGYVTKKQKKNIIRLPKLPKSDDFEEKERFSFSKLMTYVPWRQELLEDVKSQYKTYSECCVCMCIS